MQVSSAAVRATFKILAPCGLLALASAVAPSCNVYDAALKEPFPVAGGGSAGASGATSGGWGKGWWSKPGDKGCFSAGVPTAKDRPAPAAGGKDRAPFFVGITKLRLGSQNESGMEDGEAWKDIGFDLDGACTSSPTCGIENDNAGCNQGAIPARIDGNECRDNNFGRFEVFVAQTPEVGAKYRLNDTQFNCGLCAGHYNFLIRVSGYNGEPNDDDLRLDVYPSIGLQASTGIDCAKATEPSTLCWLSTDPFILDETGFDGPKTGETLPNAKVFDAHAYVREGYLVATLPDDASFWFPTEVADGVNTFPIKIQKAVVTGRIEKAQDGTIVVKDGVIAGRVKKDDVIGGFRQIGLCENEGMLYKTMVNYVSSNLDVMASGINDPSAPCDALSVGVGFEAKEAVAAATTGKATPLTECFNPFATGGAGGAAGAGGAGSGGASAGGAGASAGAAGATAGSAGAGG